MLRYEEDRKVEKFGKTWSIKNMISTLMVVVVASILVVVVLAYLTEITFQGEINWQEQGANAVLLVVCSVSVTVILRKWGIMKGEDAQEHVEAIHLVERNVGKIIEGHNSGRAAEYCKTWEEDDYEQTVSRVLSAYNITFEKFKEVRIFEKSELQTKYPSFSKSQVKAILSAKKIKRLKYSEDFILTAINRKEKRCSPSAELTTDQRNAIMTVQNIILSIILSIVMVSFAVDIISDPTLATVVSCLLKVITIILSGIWAAYSGYNLTANIDTERLKRQATEQERFIAFCEKNKVKGTSDETMDKETMVENQDGSEKPVPSA